MHAESDDKNTGPAFGRERFGRVPEQDRVADSLGVGGQMLDDQLLLQREVIEPQFPHHQAPVVEKIGVTVEDVSAEALQFHETLTGASNVSPGQRCFSTIGYGMAER
jgi:hypothetical protein